MNSDHYFCLMCFYANKHDNGTKMPEYEFLAYEAMCRSQASLAIMQEAAFKLETQKLNAQLDDDASRDTRQSA